MSGFIVLLWKSQVVSDMGLEKEGTQKALERNIVLRI